MEWNGRHLCPVRRQSCPPPPPAHFSLFPCFRGWWMVARRLGGWFLAVSRFCFDPLSVRSTLIAGAKKRSDCRGKKPNRMHGFGGWMWKYTKIFRGYALGATKVFASPPAPQKVVMWRLHCSGVSGFQSWSNDRSWPKLKDKRGRAREDEKDRTGQEVPPDQYHLLLNQWPASSVLHIPCVSYLYPNIYNHTYAAYPPASFVFFFGYLSPIYLPVPLQSCVTECERDGGVRPVQWTRGNYFAITFVWFGLWSDLSIDRF